MSAPPFKKFVYIGGLAGLLVLVAVLAHTDLAGIVRAVQRAGWQILWLLPYRLIFFALYALAWEVLLRPYDPRGRLSLAYLGWVVTVRESIDRLLPVASVGGGVVGVWLLVWRGIPSPMITATIVVEVLLTLVALWVFTLIGLGLLAWDGGHTPHLTVVLALGGFAVPVALALGLRYGAVFGRLEAIIGSIVGIRSLSGVADSLDAEVRATLRRKWRAVASGTLQLLAMLSGAFEVWFSLRLFGHPVDFRGALIMESLTQAVRHLAFMIPGAIGAQEFALVFFGSALGVGADLALAVSLVKRARELAWGIPALVSWQCAEGRRLDGAQRQSS